MALVRDLREIPRQFEAHALARADRPGVFLLQPIEEIADWNAQDLRDLVEAAGRDPVNAALVFVRLLVGDPDQIGQLLLGQPQHDPPLPDSRPDMAVDILSPPGPTERSSTALSARGPAPVRRSTGAGPRAERAVLLRSVGPGRVVCCCFMSVHSIGFPEDDISALRA